MKEQFQPNTNEKGNLEDGFTAEGYRATRRQSTSDHEVGHEVEGEAHEWNYTPGEEMGASRDELIESVKKAREQFVNATSYDQFMSFRSHFAELIDGAENGGQVIYAIQEAIRRAPRRNMESFIEEENTDSMLGAVEMVLLTKPVESGYEITGISLWDRGSDNRETIEFSKVNP
jgi:hypothetical protein